MPEPTDRVDAWTDHDYADVLSPAQRWLDSLRSELLASITSKRTEQSTLLDTLRMWNDVKAQGIEPDTVRAFTFDEGKPFAGAVRTQEVNARAARLYHNVAILKDGTCVVLNPPVKRPT